MVEVRRTPITVISPVGPVDEPVSELISTEDVLPTTPEPGLIRRVLASNSQLMLVEHRMEPGWRGARHSHPHHQAVYVLSGRLRFSCGSQEFEVSGGQSFIVRGGEEHQAEALEASVVLDVFTPTRDDYR
jgi:quercetin dioxygenase-like cupin family protein